MTINQGCSVGHVSEGNVVNVSSKQKQNKAAANSAFSAKAAAFLSGDAAATAAVRKISQDGDGAGRGTKRSLPGGGGQGERPCGGEATGWPLRELQAIGKGEWVEVLYDEDRKWYLCQVLTASSVRLKVAYPESSEWAAWDEFIQRSEVVTGRVRFPAGFEHKMPAAPKKPVALPKRVRACPARYRKDVGDDADSTAGLPLSKASSSKKGSRRSAAGNEPAASKRRGGCSAAAARARAAAPFAAMRGPPRTLKKSDPKLPNHHGPDEREVVKPPRYWEPSVLEPWLLEQFAPGTVPRAVESAEHSQHFHTSSGMPEELRAMEASILHQQAGLAMARSTGQPQAVLESLEAELSRAVAAKQETAAELGSSRCAPPTQHGLQPDTMAQITSDCDAMRCPSIKWP